MEEERMEGENQHNGGVSIVARTLWQTIPLGFFSLDVEVAV
jgi:hypothetical protein